MLTTSRRMAREESITGYLPKRIAGWLGGFFYFFINWFLLHHLWVGFSSANGLASAVLQWHMQVQWCPETSRSASISTAVRMLYAECAPVHFLVVLHLVLVLEYSTPLLVCLNRGFRSRADGSSAQHTCSFWGVAVIRVGYLASSAS